MEAGNRVVVVVCRCAWRDGRGWGGGTHGTAMIKLVEGRALHVGGGGGSGLSAHGGTVVEGWCCWVLRVCGGHRGVHCPRPGCEGGMAQRSPGSVACLYLYLADRCAMLVHASVRRAQHSTCTAVQCCTSRLSRTRTAALPLGPGLQPVQASCVTAVACDLHVPAPPRTPACDFICTKLVAAIYIHATRQRCARPDRAQRAAHPALAPCAGG